MSWVRLIGSVFILGGSIVSARSADESLALMESCFKAARTADAICSKLPDDPALRVDCFQKTRSAQLDCLEHVLSETPTGTATRKTPSEVPRSNWVISETTSPIDYSPLLTALIRSTSQIKDAPSALMVRCVGQRTEFVVHTEGTWSATRGHELRVDYQVDDQPAVGLQWILSSDGKTATYKDDPVSFLQSLRDGARLKINVADRASSSHEATFQIDGWDVVRNKIGTACRWTRTTDKTSSGKQ
jgi:hypothetical protein